VFITLFAYAWVFDPELFPRPTFCMSFSIFNMTVTKRWGGQVIFFNQQAPYTGGTYSIFGDSKSAKGWDCFGIYFRSIKDQKRTDVYWTLMLSLWYPISICGILPAIVLVRKLRKSLKCSLGKVPLSRP
jgi:hypothetical protein